MSTGALDPLIHDPGRLRAAAALGEPGNMAAPPRPDQGQVIMSQDGPGPRSQAKTGAVGRAFLLLSQRRPGPASFARWEASRGIAAIFSPVSSGQRMPATGRGPRW